MNTVLWTAQICAALIFLVTGTAKLFVSREKLATRMHWAAEWPRSRIKLLGLAEVAGAAGLVLPVATGIAPVLTPIAAVCLSVLMAGAIATHRRLRENFAPAVVVALLCLGIAVGHAGIALAQPLGAKVHRWTSPPAHISTGGTPRPA